MNDSSNIATSDLLIEGMTCASCVGRVEKALSAVPGVIDAQVNLATERATVRHRTEVNESTLAAAIENAGYRHVSDEATESAAPRTLPEWWPVALAAVLSAPLVVPMFAS